MKTIAIIAARGGSVRIPRKNIKFFMGKPIIAYSIATAFESGLFDNVYVSTEDHEIACIARQYGSEVLMRDERWCRDDVGPLDVARHHIESMPDAELVCAIYPCAPLMTVNYLRLGHSLVSRYGTGYSVSVGVEPLHDAAQFFWCKREALITGLPEFAEYTTMVQIDANRDCDINTPDDWDRAEEMYRRLHAPSS